MMMMGLLRAWGSGAGGGELRRCFRRPPFAKLIISNFIYRTMAYLNREVIYTKDVMNILGCSLRSAQYTLRKIKAALGKKRSQYVSVEEFSRETDIHERIVRRFINDSPFGE